MNKKTLLSFVAAAAITFTGAATKQAHAATINNPNPCGSTVKYYDNYQEFNNYLNTILGKYNISGFNFNNFTTNQAPINVKQAQPVQAPVQSAKPVQAQPTQSAKPVQTPAKQTQPAKPVQTPAKPVQTTPSQTPAKPATSASQLSAYEQKVVELTNVERAKQGLPALKINTELSKVARIKSQDMHDKNYFDHNSPTYGSPFDMMKKFGISYSSAGENIAQGQRTPEEVVKAWMDSPGHRANILNSSFTEIGVGYVADRNYWTQQFIGK